MGQKFVENGDNFQPFGFTLSHSDQMIMEIIPPLGSNKEIRDQLVKKFAKMAKAGQIKASVGCVPRTLHHAPLISVGCVRRTVIGTNEEEAQRLHQTFDRILNLCETIQVVPEILSLAATFRGESLELSLQDSIVYHIDIHV